MFLPRPDITGDRSAAINMAEHSDLKTDTIFNLLTEFGQTFRAVVKNLHKNNKFGSVSLLFSNTKHLTRILEICENEQRPFPDYQWSRRYSAIDVSA